MDKIAVVYNYAGMVYARISNRVALAGTVKDDNRYHLGVAGHVRIVRI